MGSWLSRLRRGLQGHRPAPKRPSRRPTLETLEERCVMSSGAYLQTNLVSDVPGLARLTDSNLKNPC
jgi:hypothetical protein